MSTNKTVAFVFAFVIALAITNTCIAQNNSAQAFVDVHNKARLDVGVGNVTWDETVASYAKNYSMKRKADCKLALSPNSTYGENIFVGSGKDYTGVDAVNLWVSKKQYYNHSNNTCAFNQTCMTYTQVVWKNSTKIGCARVVCDKSAGIFIMCSYDPPGNTEGQKPY